MKINKSIIRRIVLGFIGIVLGISVYFMNASSTGNQLPMPLGIGLANVLSGSMEPTFSKGTLLIVRESNDIDVGDIVVYQSQGELIVHRVVEVDQESVVTKGDANNVCDEPFVRSQVKGIVCFYIPFLGTLLSIFKTPIGIILLIVLAILLIELSFNKQKEQDDKEIEAIKEEIRKLKEK